MTNYTVKYNNYTTAYPPKSSWLKYHRDISRRWMKAVKRGDTTAQHAYHTEAMNH